MRVGSAFSGVGALDLGLQRAGMEIQWQIEINESARSILQRHWPCVPKHASIIEVTSDQLGPVDLICGGPPCQDWSRGQSNSREGLVGSRSGLFFEFARLIRDLQPRWVVMENVPGLLTTNGGRDFSVVLGVMVELGYGVAWRVLDAAKFGVPQRRRRIFIVGCLGDPGRAARVLLEPDSGDGGAGEDHQTGQPLSRAPAKRPHGYSAWRKSWRSADDQKPETWVEDSITNTLNEFDYTSTQFIVGDYVRRLTPLEWERLQGLPDSWTDGQAAHKRIAQIGNAVAVPVAHWVGRRIIEAS